MIISKCSPLLFAMLLALACRPRNPAATLSLAYPELLREARIDGVYRFTVGLDSTGVPDPSRLHVVSSPNPGFDMPIRRAVTLWRPDVPRGTDSIARTVVFVILPIGADSVRDCPAARNLTLVCAVDRPVSVRDEGVHSEMARGKDRKGG